MLKTMPKTFLAAAAALSAVPALAHDADKPFDGPFVGVQAGWQQDNLNFTNSFDDSENGVSGGGVLVKKPSFTYGAQVGYDKLVTPSIVLGVEGSITGVTSAAQFGDAAGNAYSWSVGRTLTASARAGYRVLPKGLLYLRAGYTNASFTIDDPVASEHQNRDGVLFGIGYEHAIAGPVSARIEYDYSHFGHGDLPGIATDTAATTANGDYDRHAVTMGINFRF